MRRIAEFTNCRIANLKFANSSIRKFLSYHLQPTTWLHPAAWKTKRPRFPSKLAGNLSSDLLPLGWLCELPSGGVVRLGGTVNKTRRITLLLAVSAVTLLLAGCPQHRTIAEINRDPSYFMNKEVVVTGTVRHSYGLLGQGVFELDDGTGSIWVLSENYGVPADNTKVGVQGTVIPT